MAFPSLGAPLLFPRQVAGGSSADAPRPANPLLVSYYADVLLSGASRTGIFIPEALDKGKPIERWGRKAMGLNPLTGT